MDGVNLNDIVAQGRQATRQEKNLLFKVYVCETTCIRVVKMMSETELNRILALHLFDLHVLQHRKNRKLVVKHLELALGVSQSTMYRWFPAKEVMCQLAED